MFEVGKIYTDARGTERKCVGIDGEHAYLARNGREAYRWTMDGIGVDLGEYHDIPALYPRPVIKWYPGDTAPKDGSKFMAKYGAIDILTWRDGGFYRVAGGSQYGKVQEWSPLPK